MESADNWKLAEISRTPFEGDLLDAVTTFERRIEIFEAPSVIAGKSQSSMREHILLSATKCDSWTNFVREVESVEHAKKTTSAPTPVEFDGLVSR